MSDIYYNVKPCLSRGAFLNFIVGGRGTGKTFNCKKFCIEDYIKHKRQFFYVRRYNTELELALTGFFEQLQHEHYFEDRVFKIVKHKKHLIEFQMDGETIGYACALSTALIMKSASFPDVYNLIYDEALIARGSSYKYLKNETIQFLELLETVFRLRKGRVMILSNAITVANPYYDYFEIKPEPDKQFKTYHNGDICLEQVESKEFTQMKLKTPIGRLIQGSRYGDYAINNKMLQDDGTFIGWKPASSNMIGVIKVDNATYGLWSAYKTGCLYVSYAYNPNCKEIIALSPSDHNEDSVLIIKSNDWLLEKLRTAFQYGCLYFDSESVKAKVLRCLIGKFY